MVCCLYALDSLLVLGAYWCLRLFELRCVIVYLFCSRVYCFVELGLGFCWICGFGYGVTAWLFAWGVFVVYCDFGGC